MKDFWYNMRMLVNCLYPVGLVFLMTEFKCSERLRKLAMTGAVLTAAVSNQILFYTIGREKMMNFFPFLLLFPCIAVLLVLGKDRPSQLFFSFFTAVNMLYLASIISILATGMDKDKVWLETVVRALVYTVILIIFRKKLFEPYHFLARHMEKGWTAIALIPFLFFFLVMILGVYPTVRQDNFLGVLILYVILGFVYYIIYRIFHTSYRLINERMDNELLQSQVLAFTNQSGVLRDTREEIRTYRHDMRHYVKNIEVLVRKGDMEAALGFIDDFESKLDDTEQKHYCENVTLDALLTYYLKKVGQQGIEIETKLDIPQELPVDVVELSTVFANAIENACTACNKIKEDGEKKIELKCISTPQFIFEIANTYQEEIRFDKDGRPISGEEGHGIGTRSIAAFAERHGAVLDYKVTKDRFCLRILLNNE